LKKSCNLPLAGDDFSLNGVLAMCLFV